MEYCDDGDLSDKIKERRESQLLNDKPDYFSESQVLNWFTQICLGVKHMHDNSVIHRDLKPENILIEGYKEFDKLKIIDFGDAYTFSQNEVITEKIGTPYYVAPEVLNKNYT